MKTIKRSDFYKIHGLLALAEKHTAALNEIKEALEDITGENDLNGHCCDAVYCGYTTEILLKHLHIKVGK